MIENKKTAITVLLGFSLISALNWLAHSPLIFAGTVVSFIGLILSAWKFSESFEAKLFFKKSSGRNYWNGAFAGVLASTFAIIVSPLDGAFIEVLAVITGLTVHAALLMTLFYGSILQDIEKGDIELETKDTEIEKEASE